VSRHRLTAAAVAILLPAAVCAAEPTAWYEGFEGTQTSWRDAGSDARYRIEDHRRTSEAPHSGSGCERLSVVGEAGTRVLLAHPIGRARVIEDLSPSVWVRSNRSGVRISARVVLPRTPDPRSGRPLSTTISGSTYTDVGRWQQLRIQEVPTLVARQVRVLRSELGSHVDAAGAYLDRMLLDVYGGPGAVTVWLDDLDVAGYVEAPPRNLATAHGPRLPDQPTWMPAGGGPAARSRVRLAGSVLMVDGRPFFPRVIQHQGEALSTLKQLGFNAVWLKRPPTEELLAEAARLELWLVCPPTGSAGAVPSEFGSQYAPVLAWDLGHDLAAEQLEPTRDLAETVRRADRLGGRPLVCRPVGDLRGFSRHTDLLLLGRRPLGSSLELNDYAEWIRRQPRLALPGTPVWTLVQTEPSEELQRQLAAVDPDDSTLRTVAPEQVRLLAFLAVSAGSRGLVFESRSPLDAADPASRHRARMLEMVNIELSLVSGWAASGGVGAKALTNQAEVVATAVRAGRSHLLMPIWSGRGAQFVPGQAAGNGVALVVPGVPEDSAAYRILPGRLEPLRPERVAGGKQVLLPEFGMTDLVMMGQDPLLVAQLSKATAKVGGRAATLGRDLTIEKLQTVEAVIRKLAPTALPEQASEWIDSAREELGRCESRLAVRDYAGAQTHTKRAARLLRLVERGTWQRVVEATSSPMVSPATVGFHTLAWHRPLTARITAARPSSNRLPAAGFEDLQQMQAAGWRHYRYPIEGVETSAGVDPKAVTAGRMGLRLTAAPEDPEQPPAMIEVPPIWITSPGVPLEAGQLVRIQGWVDVPEPITGSVDGLMIFDSFSGEALAERIGETKGWQPFLLYRLAPSSGMMRLTFALTGLGEARLDEVSVQVLEPPAPNELTRQPQAFPRR